MRRPEKTAAMVMVLMITTVGSACDLDLTGLDFGGGGVGWGGGWGPYRSVRIEGLPLLAVGDTARLTATYHDSEVDDPAQGTFTWASGDTALIAIDDEGLVRAKLAGWTEITAVHDSTGLIGRQEARVVIGDASVRPAAFRDLALGTVGCGIDSGGAVLCWGPPIPWQPPGAGYPAGGGRSTPTPVGADRSFERVFIGQESVCALTPDGAAYCWGENWSGELGVGDLDRREEPTPVSGGLAFRTLAVAVGHSCALTPEGAAYCWGANELGQLGTGEAGQGSAVPTAVTGDLRFVAVAAGGFHSCAIAVDSIAYCWGGNDVGQLGDGSEADRAVPAPVAGDGRFTAIAALVWGPTCAIDGAGRILCWGPQPGSDATRREPWVLDDARRYTAVSGLEGHFCALAETGGAYCWGENWAGQLGDGTTTRRPTPVPVSGGHRFHSISAGAYATCGLDTDGAAYCWGDNHYGLLGTGTFEPSYTPAPVVMLD